jgi:hypothetical protein
MVEVDKTERFVTLTGCSTEMVAFYFFWQTKLWPGWMDDKDFGKPGGFATEQHKSVMENIASQGKIFLLHSGDLFEAAYEYAVEKCRAIDIQVKVETPVPV